MGIGTSRGDLHWSRAVGEHAKVIITMSILKMQFSSAMREEDVEVW